MQNGEDRQQKPDVAPQAQNDLMHKQLFLTTENKRDVAPIEQNGRAHEQPTKEVQSEPVPFDDEETLRRPRNLVRDFTEVTPPQTEPEMHTNKSLLKNGILLGGLVVGLGTGVLLALLQRDRIRQFVISTIQAIRE